LTGERRMAALLRLRLPHSTDLDKAKPATRAANVAHGQPGVQARYRVRFKPRCCAWIVALGANPIGENQRLQESADGSRRLPDSRELGAAAFDHLVKPIIASAQCAPELNVDG
jgi:hypothetical protein